MTPNQPIKLYRHPLSGHAHRAQLALSLMGLPHELIDVDLMKGAHKTPEFLKLNPFGQVPVLDDGGDVVFDSNAILVYLATKYDADRRWLPRDPKGQAAVQAWLSVAAGQIAFGPAAARLITVFGAKYNPDDVIGRAHALLKVMESRSWRTPVPGRRRRHAGRHRRLQLHLGRARGQRRPRRPTRTCAPGWPASKRCPASCRSRRQPSAWRPDAPRHPSEPPPWTPPADATTTPSTPASRPCTNGWAFASAWSTWGSASSAPPCPSSTSGSSRSCRSCWWARSTRPGGPGRRCWSAEPGFMQAPDAHSARHPRPPDPRRPAGRRPRPGRAAGLSRHRAAHAPAQPRERPCAGERCAGLQRRGRPDRGQLPAVHPGPRVRMGARRRPTCARAPSKHWTRWTHEARALIARSDTLFVATHAPARRRGETGRGADVSHRGGRAGFVRVEDERSFLVPDFTGNFFFMTLGNLQLNPRAGVLFIDFDTGDLLTLTGTAEVVWDGEELKAFDGRRACLALPRREPAGACATRCRCAGRSATGRPTRSSPAPGTRPARRREAQRLAQTWRPYRVTRVVDESSVIRSFHLQPADGHAVPPFQAGQHLPIRLQPAGGEAPLQRTYTISQAPSDDGPAPERQARGRGFEPPARPRARRRRDRGARARAASSPSTRSCAGRRC